VLFYRKGTDDRIVAIYLCESRLRKPFPLLTEISGDQIQKWHKGGASR
jgi:hypothetical protein